MLHEKPWLCLAVTAVSMNLHSPQVGAYRLILHSPLPGHYFDPRKSAPFNVVLAQG